MVHSCRDFFFFSLASLGASSPSRERISWRRPAWRWPGLPGAAPPGAGPPGGPGGPAAPGRSPPPPGCGPAERPHRSPGPKACPGAGWRCPGRGSTCLSKHSMNSVAKCSLPYFFFSGWGSTPFFHVVVHHRAGEHPALHLPLEKGQALVAVVQHLVHVKGDGRQLLPAGQRLFLSRPGPGGHVPFLLRHLRSLLCGSFLQFTRWERESQFRLPLSPIMLE